MRRRWCVIGEDTPPLSLSEDNEDVFELWTNCISQWRMSMSGPIGLDYTAVIQIAQILGVPVDVVVMRKIRLLEAEALRMMQDKEKSSDQKQKRCSNVDACAICAKICDSRVSF